MAKRAGVAKGTIYLYFQGKESLFQELVREMLTPVVGTIEAMGEVDLPARVLADRIADFFVREVYETRRRDVIRLMMAEGPRFPQLAEFYYREVLSRIIAAMRALLARAAARGEVPASLVDFPQIVAAPGLIAIVWSGLFERFEPLDVRAMMKTHIDLHLFARRGAMRIKPAALAAMLAALALAGCNETNDRALQGWVEADFVFVSPDSRAASKS